MSESYKLRLSLLDYLKYLEGSETSRCVYEGKAVLNEGHVVLCDKTLIEAKQNKINIVALCIQSSAINADPHKINGVLDVEDRKVTIESMVCLCLCKAGNSGRCKHISAVLLKCNRTLSTHNSPVVTKPKHMASKEETEEFMSLFPDIVSDFVENSKRLGNLKLSEHLETLLRYNIPTGKQLRGLGLVVAYKMMESPENLTSENIRLTNILGWCIEIFFSFIVMVDDMLDNSEIRRGCTCWYKVKGVGLQAVNDCIIIENGAFMIIQKYFANHSNYVKILEIFHDSVLKTHMGQCCDLMSMAEGKPNFKLFTMEAFKATAQLKTSYFLTYLPITLAMHLSQKYDEDVHQQAKDILLEMGEFYQIQDDILDWIGNPAISGKDVNDICEGKCTWLAVVTLQRGTPEQIRVFKEHYGKGNNAESEQIVRNLYEELGLLQVYTTYEKESYNLIRTRIQQTFIELPHELLFKFVENIYGR